MLTIRKAQVQAFEKAAERRFEDGVVSHLKTFAPKHSELLGDDGLHDIVRLGRERARKYGFSHQGPVRFYIELIFLLGCDFDSDPQYPWAAAILNDPAPADQHVKANRLFEKVMEYLERVAGPDRRLAVQALQRVKASPGVKLPAGADLDAYILERLSYIYPEKHVYVGTAALKELIRRAGQSAAAYAPASASTTAIFTGLMFAMGHGFATDPQYPWVQSTLRNAAVPDPRKRVERLYSKSLTYLDQVLAHLSRE